MVTCEQCKRTGGYGQFGTNWVCEDCKVGLVEKKIPRLRVSEAIHNSNDARERATAERAADTGQRVN